MSNSRIVVELDTRMLAKGRYKLRCVLPKPGISVRYRLLVVKPLFLLFPSSNSCLVLQTPLIDGSSCGYGGRCYNQTCQAGSAGSTVSSWIDQNLQIAIPVIVIGSLLASRLASVK